MQVALPDDVFEGHIEALVEARLQRDNNLSEMATRHWGEIDARRCALVRTRSAFMKTTALIMAVDLVRFHLFV